MTTYVTAFYFVSLIFILYTNIYVTNIIKSICALKSPVSYFLRIIHGLKLDQAKQQGEIGGSAAWKWDIKKEIVVNDG